MGEAVLSLMGICKEENSSTVWLEVALALYRENNLTDSLQGKMELHHLHMDSLFNTSLCVR